MAKKKNENVVKMEQPVEKNEQVEEATEEKELSLEDLGFIFYGDLGIKIKSYPSLEEYEMIAKYVTSLNSWAERVYSVDLMILNMFTDIEEDDVTKIATSMPLTGSELMKNIRNRIFNINLLDEAIAYYDSPSALVKLIMGAVGEVIGTEKIQEILNFKAKEPEEE